jgi:hypothetical protein
MRLPSCALIAGNHLNADVITSAIITNDHGTPARLFLIVRFFSVHLLIVVSFRRRPLSPLTPPSIDRSCYRCPITSPTSIVITPPPSIDLTPANNIHRNPIAAHWHRHRHRPPIVCATAVQLRRRH